MRLQHVALLLSTLLAIGANGQSRFRFAGKFLQRMSHGVQGWMEEVLRLVRELCRQKEELEKQGAKEFRVMAVRKASDVLLVRHRVRFTKRTLRAPHCRLLFLEGTFKGCCLHGSSVTIDGRGQRK